MTALEALPLVEREQMVTQLLGRYRVDPCRLEDFKQEAHLNIANQLMRALRPPGTPGAILRAPDPAPGALRGYVYFVVQAKMGRWLMQEASLLSGGRNGDRRKRILAETCVIGDDCLTTVPGRCASPETLVGDHHALARAGEILDALAAKYRAQDALACARAADDARLPSGDAHAKMRRSMRKLRSEARGDRELTTIARQLGAS